MFVSDKAVFRPPAAIRGGVPVCFPQFGKLGPLGQHGFARNTAFEVVAVEAAAGDDGKNGGGDGSSGSSSSSSVTLVMRADGKEDERFPHPFELKVVVSLEDESLTQELVATNTGQGAMKFTAALHTYFSVSDASKARVEGLDGVAYTDSLQGGKELRQEGPVVFREEVDRIYLRVPDDSVRVSFDI